MLLRAEGETPEGMAVQCNELFVFSSHRGREKRDRRLWGKGGDKV